MSYLIKTLKVISLCMSLVIFNSCNTEMEQVEKEVLPEVSYEQLLHSYDEFAQILARAVVEPEVQEFIKQEALKQFDKDYDVLVHLVKNKPVRDGMSFKEVLMEYDNKGLLEAVLNQTPLLTIFVPDLSKFSPNTWNTKNATIPLVAVRNVESKEKLVVVYNQEGDIINHPLNVEPDFPILVIKENERLVVSSTRKQSQVSRVDNSSKRRIITDDFKFEFISEDFEAKKSITPSGRGPGYLFPGISAPLANVDPKVRTAYKKATQAGCSNCYHRDYIYYDIFEPDGENEGPIDATYEEAITAIKFKNATAVEQAADWTEGNLEFYMYVFYIGSSSGLDKTHKVYNIPKDDLLNNSGTAPREYVFDPPVSIVTWDMKEYGDRWKLWMYENDPSTEVNRTITHSTVRGTNFEIKQVGPIKIGGGFGGSSTTTRTETTTLKYTTGSNDLGEAILEWTDPIVVDHMTMGLVGQPPSSHAWNPTETYVENTGSVLISVETIKK